MAAVTSIIFGFAVSALLYIAIGGDRWDVMAPALIIASTVGVGLASLNQ